MLTMKNQPCEDYREMIRHFIETGEMPDDGLDHVDQCLICQKCIDEAMEILSRKLEKLAQALRRR